MRVDLYTAVHKAQRFHLCRLAVEIGRADFSNATTSERIASGLRHLLDHLRDHARNEETYIHPLFKRSGKTAEHLESEHQELEAEIARLEAIVNEKRWSDLYSRYTLFLGKYLLHLDEEERAQTEVLWVNCEDKELAAVFNRFKAERSPQASKADLELMLPALSVPELTRMFFGMKASAPEAAFRGACDLAARTLESAEWEKLKRALFSE